MEVDPAFAHSQKELLQQIIYLMGTSFILGSLVTILLLMLVDFIHSRISAD